MWYLVPQMWHGNTVDLQTSSAALKGMVPPRISALSFPSPLGPTETLSMGTPHTPVPRAGTSAGSVVPRRGEERSSVNRLRWPENGRAGLDGRSPGPRDRFLATATDLPSSFPRPAGVPRIFGSSRGTGTGHGRVRCGYRLRGAVARAGEAAPQPRRCCRLYPSSHIHPFGRITPS